MTPAPPHPSAKRALVPLFLLLASLACLPGAAFFGPVDIPWERVLDILLALFGDDPRAIWGNEAVIVLDIRLGRACLAWLVGAALAMSGATLQGALSNPLADPFTIGIAGGAALGASLAITLGAVHPGLLPLAAMAGALAALGGVLVLGRVSGGYSRENVILAGIIAATFLSACVSLVKSLDEDSVASIVFWVMGSFQGRSWDEVRFLLPYALPAMLATLFLAKELDLLSMGEVHARVLGLDTGRARLALLLAAGLMTAAAVSVAGVIGFVGLVAPHLVRLASGSSHKPLLLFSALAGGLALVASDVAARIVLGEGRELPVGVVTALVGGPFFGLLLARSGRKRNTP